MNNNVLAGDRQEKLFYGLRLVKIERVNSVMPYINPTLKPLFTLCVFFAKKYLVLVGK